MAVIQEIIRQTQNKFLNMFEFKGINKVGHNFRYFVASRAETESDLKAVSGENHPDGVIMYALYGEKKDRVVLIRQFRIPLGGYLYEFPAGLVEKGEDYRSSAVREMHEETGLEFTPVNADPMFEAPRFTTAGLTDESCCMVYGYASGEPSRKYLEEGEEIQIVLADRREVRRILKEERVALMCAYQLMHFLADSEPFGFLQEEKPQEMPEE
ncbi:MAG: NUDIX hydrolase [Eubacteriales bacterium]|nr:NUDIX hydrolase [Eubacteriales bacterium]